MPGILPIGAVLAFMDFFFLDVSFPMDGLQNVSEEVQDEGVVGCVCDREARQESTSISSAGFCVQ